MLVVIVIAIFCGGAISASANNVAHPRCAQVAAGNAQLPADGACYGGSSFQQYGTLVAVCLGGGAVALAAALSLVLLVTGRRGRPFLIALGSGIVLLLTGILIAQASSSRLPRGAATPAFAIARAALSKR